MGKRRRAGRKKVRTREHRLAAESVAHVEAVIAAAGFTAERVQGDYGYDLLLFTYGPGGEVENGLVFLQVKATDALTTTAEGIVFRLDARDCRLWTLESYPVFLIVYDAQRGVAYWLYTQNYFETDPTRKPTADALTLRVVIPTTNVLDDKFFRYARDRKADILRQQSGKIDHHA